MKKSILMGVIGAPHGIKGELRIKPFGDDPFKLLHYPLYDSTGRHIQILDLRLHKAHLIAHIDGVQDRDAAQKLQGLQLFVDRQMLDEDLEEEEFYQADLLGFHAVALESQGGQTIGHISGFFNFGAGDLVEISAERGKSWLIPFSRAAVPVIDKERSLMGIDLLAAGLIEDEKDEQN